MELSRSEFELLRNHVYKICGLVIPDNKEYLIRHRLEPIVLYLGCKSFSDFCQKVSRSEIQGLDEQIINAITTNETSFLRDEHPFIALRDYILPKLGTKVIQQKSYPSDRTGKKVRCWSAGSSTGQEPYSIAMMICEYLESGKHHPVSKEDFDILATDISSRMILKAIEGSFSEDEIRRGLNDSRIKKFFELKESKWIVSGTLKSMIEFRKMNLTHNFSMFGMFDLILCRNVLIYFDLPTKAQILDKFYRMLSDEGYLLLGSTENVYGISDRFYSVRYGDSVIYRKCL